MKVELNTPLTVDEIDFRVQSINRGGYATILAYKDARADMNRLDAAVGPMNWKREHLNGNHNCIISIWDEDKKQWISKEDTGTESMADKEKGLASDAFKRAGFNWGIGRELYDYPVIQIKLNANQEQGKEKYGEWYLDNGKPKQGYGLKLKSWKWFSQFTDGKLNFLAAKDQNGNVRFKYGEYIKEEQPQKA